MKLKQRNAPSSRALLCLFAVLSLVVLTPARVSAPPTGSYFSHIVIIAMENQNYGSVVGNANAPFINNVLVPASSTISTYHSYGQNISGCSAGCYEAFTSGQQSHHDGWCPRTLSPCYTIPNIADQLSTAGLTSAMFCEDGCPRDADHFPWMAYTSTWNSCLTSSFTCNGQTGSDGNRLYASTSSNPGIFNTVAADAGNAAFINYLNSSNPANYIWFTPSDSHNMHSDSVQTGDNYLASLLVGSGGTLSNPNPGTLFSTSLFKQTGTFLYIWWDEYDPSPNIEYGSMIKACHMSAGGYTEYDSLHTIEANWALPYLTNVVAGDSSMTDLFATSTSPALCGGFSISPVSPTAGATITFSGSATGGTLPYSYTWSFGDGSIATGAMTTHTYSKSGIYTVIMNTTDSANQATTKIQQILVGQPSSPSGPPSLFSPLSVVLTIPLVVAGVFGVSVILARRRARTRLEEQGGNGSKF